MSLQITQAPTFILLKSDTPNPILLEDPINNNLVDFIKEKTGIKITIDRAKVDLHQLAEQMDPELQESKPGQSVSSSFVVLFMGGAAFGLFFLFVYSLLFGFWTKKKFFGAVAAITYLLCVGGTIFCVLNDSPFWYFHPSGQMKVFYPQYNHQFLFEGLLAGSTMLIFALSLIIMHEFVPYMEEGFYKRLVGIVCLWLFFSSLLTLVMFFTWKNEYYMADTGFGPYLAKLRDLLK